jgi:pimeloyl-ACP methyl ester carboxylesterase
MTTASRTTSIVPQFPMIQRVKIRYPDSGGSRTLTLLLTSPWPESVYAFAPTWAMLAEYGRLFAVDLPGFGASERFVWEEAPTEYASIILDSITGNRS